MKDTTGEAEITIIDTPPRIDAPGLSKVFSEADVAILVAFPSPPDIWTTAKAFEKLKESHSNLKPRLLFTGVEKGTTLGEMLDAMASQIAIKRLNNVLHKRTAYRMAALQGASAFNVEAREEIFKLAAEIATI